MGRARTWAALIVAWSGCAAHPAAGDPRPTARERVPFGADLRAAELRYVAKTIAESYSHLAAKQAEWGVDLDKLVEKYEPAIREADSWTRYEMAMVLFASEFHDAHLGWRRARAAGETRRRIARLGLSTLFIGEALYVRDVWAGSAAARAGVRVGDRIVAIDGASVEERFDSYRAVRSWSRLADARHDFGDDWPASRYDAGTSPREREITRLRGDGSREALRLAPETAPPPGRVREPALAALARDGVTLLRLRTLRELVDPARLDALAASLMADAHGLVIDLRDNAGGYEHQARALVGRLAARRIVGGYVRVRLTARVRAEHGEWKRLDEDPAMPGWSLPQEVASEPAAQRDYPARIAVLIDAGCRSACETAALQLRALGGRVFGETSGGSSGAPVAYALPWSHAQITIPAWEMVDLANHPIEGRGIVPDETIEPQREDLIVQRDPALLRALEWARGH